MSCDKLAVMLRRIMLALIPLAALGASHPDKPPFEFKGYTAGQIAEPKILKGCALEGAQRVCRNFRDEVAGVPATTVMNVYEGKLSSAIALVPVNAYPDVLRAVTAKYGESCYSGAETWRNAMGASLENPVNKWCFATGELTLKRVSGTLKYMFFYYQDENQPPAEKPKVDF